MEKISGIIPSSPRMKAVDMRETTPVRPGVPAFGRPEAMSSAATRNAEAELSAVAPTTAMKATAVQTEALTWKSKDLAHAALASKMSDSFFMKNKVEAEPVKREEEPVMNMLMDREVKSKPTGFKNDDIAAFRANAHTMEDYADDEINVARQPEGLFPKGSFISRMA